MAFETARFFHQMAHRLNAAHASEAFERDRNKAHVEATACRLLREYAETVQSKAKHVEIWAVIKAMGYTEPPAYDPTRMTMGDTP